MGAIANAFQILAALKESVPTLRFRPGMWSDQSPGHVTITFEFIAGTHDFPRKFGSNICFSTTADDAEAIAALERAATEIHIAYKRASDPAASERCLFDEIQQRLDLLADLRSGRETAPVNG